MKLSAREKRLIMILAVLALSAAVFTFATKPARPVAVHGTLTLDQSRQDLRLIEELYREYSQLMSRKRKFETGLSRPESLMESIEKAAAKNELTEQKSSLREEPEKKRNNLTVKSATVKFESAPMSRIVQFLADMEGGTSLTRVTYFNARRAVKGKNVFDVTVSYELYTR